MRVLVFLGFVLVCGLSSSAQQGEARKGFYADGKLRYEGFFVGGTPVGAMTRYYPDGTVQAKLFHRGDTTDAVLYGKGGEYATEGRYVKRLKDGEWRYKKGERLVAVETYRADVMEGVSLRYYASGALAEEKGWKAGQPDGMWRTYYSDGQLRIEATYADGKLEGTMRAYRPDGEVMADGRYQKGLREGEWHYYMPDGKGSRIRVYAAGVAADQTEEDIEESRQMDKMLEEGTKIIDPNRFTDDPETYLRIANP